MTAELAGKLERYGFEEPEPGLIPDTYENKQRLRALGSNWQWETVFDENGNPSGLIRPFTPEEVTVRRESAYEARKDILVDPNDPWSDYVHPSEYPLDMQLPYWVGRRLQKWRELDREGVPEDERKPFPIRCTLIRDDGTRCWNWVDKPHEVTRCRYHIGWTRNSRELRAAYAKNSIIEALPAMADNLVRLAFEGETHAVQLKATTEILDRGGVRGGVEIDMDVRQEVVDPSAALRERLSTLAARVIEALPAAKAEVVSDDES